MKFVGTMKGLKRELREVREHWGILWRERKTFRNGVVADLQMQAQWGREVWEHFGGDDWRVVRMEPRPQPTDLGCTVYSWFDWLRMFVTSAVSWIPCWALGHKLKDDSHAGPDSGSMGVYCTRCGWEASTTLY